MYYHPLDTPGKAHNTICNDQLGQVRYFFSDKTSTLTWNVVTYRKWWVNSIVYSLEVQETLC